MKALALLFFFVTSYLEIVPGTSTRTDVDRVLGQPLRTVAESVLEYAPQKGTGPIRVEYRAGGGVVDRIEVPMSKPVKRQAMIAALSLPEPDARDDSKGRLMEFFGSSFAVAFTYASADEKSGIVAVEYFSREFFEKRFDAALAGEKKVTRDPAQCRDVYDWATTRQRLVKKDPARLQSLLEVRILAQRGDCARARKAAAQLGF
jgi:hypothetical protein